MAFLTKEAILNVDDLPYEDVEVPEWGGTVRVRMLSGTEKEAYENSLFEIKGTGKNMTTRYIRENSRAKLLVRVLVDEQGEPLFTQKEVDRLGKKSAIALDRLYEKARRLNGMDSEADETAENFSEGGENDISISASPES